MPVIVTGAGGFVGRQIVSRLLAQGRRVVAMDAVAGGIPDGARMVVGDLGDASVRADALAGGVSAVIHLATVPGGAAEADPVASRRINIDAMYDLCWRPAQRQANPGLFMPVRLPSMAIRCPPCR
jgi:nucleoside-diphosphate-sugar epimerase